jgi:putative transposase
VRNPQTLVWRMNRVVFFSRLTGLLLDRRARLAAGAMKPCPGAKFMELVSGSHSVGQNLYHLEWCPKYRYNMFRGKGNKKLCEDVLHEVAERHNIGILELSVMPDHVHTVVQLPLTMSVSKALQLLKGASSYELFKQKPGFRQRYPQGHFWSPGKFYRTVGDADAETVIQYVHNHRLQQTSLDVFPTTSNQPR